MWSRSQSASPLSLSAHVQHDPDDAGSSATDVDSGFANFTSGGQEANHTAVAVALTEKFPALARNGLRDLDGQPTFYLSAEAHHSFDKVAHVTGLGRDAMRVVPVRDERQTSRKLHKPLA